MGDSKVGAAKSQRLTFFKNTFDLLIFVICVLTI